MFSVYNRDSKNIAGWLPTLGLKDTDIFSGSWPDM